MLQAADSLRPLALELADSLGRRLDTVAAHLGRLDSALSDPLSVRVIAQPSDPWPTVAAVVSALVLVAVTVFYQRKALHLQEDLNSVQAAANELVEKHERERIDREAEAAATRRQAVDARISAIAYALQRQLETWLEEPLEQAPSVPRAARAIVDWFRTGDERADRALKYLTEQWARPRMSAAHSGAAEDRIQQLVSMAPEASPDVAGAVRRACVEFYQGTGLVNRSIVDFKVRKVIEASHRLGAGIGALGRCESALEPAIGAELRTTRELFVRVDAVLVKEEEDEPVR